MARRGDPDKPMAGQGGPYLSVDAEGAALLLQLDGRHAWNLPGLLDVGAMGTDSQSHQVLSDLHLLLVSRGQLLTRLWEREREGGRV